MRNRGRSGVGRGCRGAGDGGGGRALSGADGGAPLPGGAAEDRRNAVVRRALARPVGGADRLLGAGAEVRRPRPLDRLGLSHAVRPPALARQQQPLPDPAGLARAESGLAGAGAVRTAAGGGLAGALRPPARAAGDLRRSGALPRHGVPRRELDLRRAHARLPSRARRLQRRPGRAEAGLRPPLGRRRAGAPDPARTPPHRPPRRPEGHDLRRHHAFPARPLRRHRRPAPPPGPAPSAVCGARHRRRRHAVRRARLQGHGRMGRRPVAARPRAVPLPAPRRPLRGAQRIRHPRRAGARRPRPARPRPAALRRRPRQRRRRHRHRRQDHAQRHLY